MEDLAIAPPDAAARPSGLTDPPSTAGPQAPAPAVLRSPEQAERLVLELIAAHADSLLRTARRYSICADDAQDAYQRGLEILIRHARRLDAERAGGWLHTVVKHEALAINKARSRIVGGEEVDLDAMEVRTAPSPEDRVLGFEQVARSAEALQRLKPQEVRALWLKAMGNSYQEICDATGWSYTKVYRPEKPEPAYSVAPRGSVWRNADRRDRDPAAVPAALSQVVVCRDDRRSRSRRQTAPVLDARRERDVQRPGRLLIPPSRNRGIWPPPGRGEKGASARQALRHRAAGAAKVVSSGGGSL